MTLLLVLSCLLLQLHSLPSSPLATGVEVVPTSTLLAGRTYYHFVGKQQQPKLTLWLSDDVAAVTFVYVVSWFPYLSPTCAVSSSPAWRAVLSLLGAALVLQEHVPANEPRVPGMRYGFRADFRRGGGALARALLAGLRNLSAQSGHPELALAPLLLWGFSREGIHAPTFAEVFPSVVLGLVRHTSHLRDDTLNFTPGGPLVSIPAYVTIGEWDNVAKMNGITFLRLGRTAGAPWSCTVVREGKHGEGYADARVARFQFPWMAELLAQLPPHLDGPYTERPVLRRFDTHSTRPPVTRNSEEAVDWWLGNMNEIIERCCELWGQPDTHKGSLNGNPFDIAPVAEFAYNASSASWLPGRTLAKVWKEVNEVDARKAAPHTVPVGWVMGPRAGRRVVRQGQSTTLLLLRTDGVHSALAVRLETSGSAAPGVDFTPLPTVVKFPEHAYGIRIWVHTNDVKERVGMNKSVRVRIVPSESSYDILACCGEVSVTILSTKQTVPVAVSEPPMSESASATAAAADWGGGSVPVEVAATAIFAVAFMTFAGYLVLLRRRKCWCK